MGYTEYGLPGILWFFIGTGGMVALVVLALWATGIFTDYSSTRQETEEKEDHDPHHGNRR